MLKPLVLALASVAVAGPASAQDVVYWPAPQSASTTTGTAYFPVGTPIAFVSPLGFLIHGTSAHLPAGTIVQATLAEDLRFARQPVGTADGAPAARQLPAHFDPAAFSAGGARTAAR